MKAIWGQYESWKSNLKSEESISTNLNQSESNLKPFWNMKSQSKTELEGKVNLTQYESNLEGKVNRTQSETELKGDFHSGGLSLRFYPRHLLLGSLLLGLDLPSLSTLIASALSCCPVLTLAASSKTCLYSSIMALSTSICRSALALAVSILAGLVVNGLYWVPNHRKV